MLRFFSIRNQGCNQGHMPRICFDLSLSVTKCEEFFFFFFVWPYRVCVIWSCYKTAIAKFPIFRRKNIIRFYLLLIMSTSWWLIYYCVICHNKVRKLQHLPSALSFHLPQSMGTSGKNVSILCIGEINNIRGMGQQDEKRDLREHFNSGDTATNSAWSDHIFCHLRYHWERE